MTDRLTRRLGAPTLLVLLTLASAASAQMMTVRERAYWGVVAQYTSVDRRVALAGIGDWSERELETITRIIEDRAKAARKCADCEARHRFDALPLRAALLLHAEYDRTTRLIKIQVNGGAAECAVNPHSAAMEKLLGPVALQPGGVDFAIRFVTALSLNLRSMLCFVSARQWAELGLKINAGNAVLQLARGLAGESIGSIGFAEPVWRTVYDARGRPISGYEAVDLKEQLNIALESFGKALALDPKFSEARLRLGRVQWRMGQSASARDSLKRAVGETEGPLLYLAHLFYGQCLEDEGEVTGAIFEYTAAMALRPDSQVGAVALAHAHTLRGESDRAREVLEGVLPFSGRRKTLDPFWSYLVGSQEVAEELLDQLREPAR